MYSDNTLKRADKNKLEELCIVEYFHSMLKRVSEPWSILWLQRHVRCIFMYDLFETNSHSTLSIEVRRNSGSRVESIGLLESGFRLRKMPVLAFSIPLHWNEDKRQNRVLISFRIYSIFHFLLYSLEVWPWRNKSRSGVPEPEAEILESHLVYLFLQILIRKYTWVNI
jgi:hypothetical protein